ncbi:MULTISPECIES: YtpR family tRNA-binding protein [unclassified Breznakia]|uniref:YtpR family tRNA-binding protein n=1 Tax=unclassified Breznakia TaxID=2623764 RepID=UPI0024754AB0|nr:MULTISPECIES: hypothetical protein [unclassified Breznakia]MDH6366317.1 tRNA-binding protein [Breznakia sp. PH1-1]MDH6403410.1 tRNA-binding protein [Breznakia sp. PF1-11]MDH6411119.1 tRNA-binding protein [Breznakia sp. PFB1-11]MDH6413618.1 tRNA-binding protein [Breznakia sp. PFB1-14]MDH6415664.1 tRNA-binding protein [Breznakia sp. PFB1-4]
MIARVFYNAKAFPGVVLVILHDEEVISTVKSKNVTKLLGKDEKLLGYNIEVDHFESDQDGYQKMTYDLLRFVNTNLHDAFDEEIIHDFNPYIVVGRVLACEDHPDSDHLHVCQVDVGKEVVQIVCGAANVKANINVVACLPNAVLPDGKFITKGKLRGIKSDGMLASAYELGLIEEKKKGILILEDEAKVGEPFFK